MKNIQQDNNSKLYRERQRKRDLKQKCIKSFGFEIELL